MGAFSGDGGNRTRVRKIKPSNIYECSHLLVFTSKSTGDPGFFWLAAKARKPLFHPFSNVPDGTPALCRPGHLQPELGDGGRDLLRGQVSSLLNRLRGEGQSCIVSAIGT